MSNVFDFQETAIYSDEPMDKADTSVLTYLLPILVLVVLDFIPLALGLKHYLS